VIYSGMTNKTYRSWDPEQPFLLPPAPRDWLPSSHLAYFILEVVTTVLDLQPFEAVIQSKDPRGNRPYSPLMMVALLLYAYCIGVVSSRQIERSTYESVPFMVITGGQHPDHASIARFRRTHIAAFTAVFTQVVHLCRQMGMLKLGRFALDGSKLKANASKHKAMSYEHMVKVEARLEEEIAELLKRAERLDQEEDEVHGEYGYEDLPAELHRREVRLARLREAKVALERGAREARAEELEEQAEQHEAKATDDDRSQTDRRRSATLGRKRRERAAELRAANAEEAPDDANESHGLPFAEPPENDGDTDVPHADSSDESADDDVSSTPAALPERTVRHTADGEPHPRAQWNFTDTDSSIMAHQGGFIQGFNCQALNDETGVIVAQAVTNVAPDTHHLPALVDQAVDTLGALGQLTADTGYWAPVNVSHCEAAGVDAYIATGRKTASDTHTPTDADGGTPSSGADPPPASAKDQMRAKTSTPDGSAIYRTRKWVAEPPFGNIKSIQCFRQFSLRGLELVRGEWSLVTAAHNLRKAWLFRTAQL
jgi:transposase